MEAAAKIYDETTGDDIIHVIKESPISFLTSYIVPKTSPFIFKLNKALIYAREFGILERSNKKIEAFLQLQRVSRFKRITANRLKEPKIEIHHMKNVFLFYLTCILVCFLVFSIEMICGAIEKRKNKVKVFRFRR